MTCFRHRRLRSRVAWIALFALLWAQVTLAGHLCVHEGRDGGDVVAEIAAEHDCHDAIPESAASNAEALVCAAHCSQGDQSADNARVPLLVALPVERWLPPALTTLGNVLPVRTLRDPRGQRHRPTAHPATLLLI